MKPDTAALATARAAIAERLGPEAVTSASLIGANFSMLDRVANAIGISVDAMIVKPTADFREALGINAFPVRSEYARIGLTPPYCAVQPPSTAIG